MRARLIALSTATTLVLAGCSLLPGQDEPTVVPSEVTQAPEGQEALARFYEQQLTWDDCEDLTGECAELEVPVDYQQPEGDVIKLKLERTLTRDHRTVAPPRGTAEAGGAVLLSGCDGVHDNMDWWAGVMLAQGRAVVNLDYVLPT